MASPSCRNCRSTRIIIQPLVSYLSLVLNQVWDSPITPTLPCQTYWRKKVNNGSALRMANCFEEIHALFKVCQGTCPCFPRSLRLAHISLYLTVVPHRRLFPALLLPYFMFFSVVIVFFVVVVGGGGGFTEKSEVAKSSSQSLFGSFYYLSIYFNSVPQNKYFLSAYGE